MDNIDELVTKICNEQNYDEMLVKIVNANGEYRIEKLLNEINDNNTISPKEKKHIYETIFEYVDNANSEIQKNVKAIFKMGVEKAINKTNTIKKEDE